MRSNQNAKTSTESHVVDANVLDYSFYANIAILDPVFVQWPDNLIRWISHYLTVSVFAMISVFPPVTTNMHTLGTRFNVKYMDRVIQPLKQPRPDLEKFGLIWLMNWCKQLQNRLKCLITITATWESLAAAIQALNHCIMYMSTGIDKPARFDIWVDKGKELLNFKCQVFLR